MILKNQFNICELQKSYEVKNSPSHNYIKKAKINCIEIFSANRSTYYRMTHLLMFVPKPLIIIVVTV